MSEDPHDLEEIGRTTLELMLVKTGDRRQCHMTEDG